MGSLSRNEIDTVMQGHPAPDAECAAAVYPEGGQDHRSGVLPTPSSPAHFLIAERLAHPEILVRFNHAGVMQ